jgi:hypothetical protein
MKNKYWIAAFSLAALLVTGKPSHAQPSTRIVQNRVITIQPENAISGMPSLWVHCGVYRDEDDNVRRDPAMDSGSSEGFAPWKGGMSFQKIGPYSVVLAAREKTGLDVLAGLIAKDGVFTARMCTTSQDGSRIETCEKKPTPAPQGIRLALETVNKTTDLACSQQMPKIISTLTPEEKSAIRKGAPTRPEALIPLLILIHDDPQ